MHKSYALNEKGRDFIIGDLHGEYHLLQVEMDRVNFNHTVDRLFSVGDLIDRGTASHQCLALIEKDWFFPVLGNHEFMMIDSLLNDDGEAYINWVMNGGDWFSEDIELSVKRLAQIAQDTVPLSMTIATKKGMIGICHAQPPSTNWDDVMNPDKKQVQTMIWGRTWIKLNQTNYVQNIGRVYCGHTPVVNPHLRGNIAYIDTGAFYTGNLTMAELTADFNDGGGT